MFKPTQRVEHPAGYQVQPSPVIPIRRVNLRIIFSVAHQHSLPRRREGVTTPTSPCGDRRNRCWRQLCWVRGRHQYRQRHRAHGCPCLFAIYKRRRHRRAHTIQEPVHERTRRASGGDGRSCWPRRQQRSGRNREFTALGACCEGK